jgi:hypothetical protein
MLQDVENEEAISKLVCWLRIRFHSAFGWLG